MKQFIKRNYEGKSEPYLYILWAAYKNISSSGIRLSNYVKEEVFNLDLDKIQDKKEKGLRILANLDTNENEGELTNYSHITSIKIKNFRGFGSLNENDQGCSIKLNKNKNIFYGPNGSGKTSLCEAFEYKLTSNIKEAKRRNIVLNEYIKRNNARVEVNLEFSDPKIITENFNEYDKEFFQICFIEKNRLQEFALLGSKDTGVKEKDIIANLLGMQELDNLITSFVKPNSFNLQMYKQESSTNALKALNDNNIVNLGKKDDIEKERSQLQNILSDNYKEDLENQEKIVELINKIEEEVVIFEEKIRSLEQKKLVIVNSISFTETNNIISDKMKYLESLYQSLSTQAMKINFANFYNSLMEISSIHVENCPACDTPLKNVVINPFIKAKEELINLKEIQNIQNKIGKIKDELNTKIYIQIENIINTFKENMENFNQLKQESLIGFIHKINRAKSRDRIEYVKCYIEEIFNLKKEFATYFSEQSNVETELNEGEIVIKQYKDKIIKSRNKITELSFLLKRFGELDNSLTRVMTDLFRYEEEKHRLEKLNEKEQNFNQFLNEVELSYESFYQDLINFKINLERERIKNIEDKVLEYYRQINKHDDEAEQITNLQFKIINENYRIYIKMPSVSTEIDAYSCLSEGHLRALGLSLMLAVAEKNNVPLLIFDDVVNAIDSDHRANIIEMLFQNHFLQRTQQIISTHDRLFWERFCNTYGMLIDKKNAPNISYILNHTNKGTILIQYNVAFTSKIEEALKNYDIRQALIYCRIWFETIVTQYCIKNNRELTARFTRDKNSNLLKASLESIYNEIITDFNNNTNLSIIKNDLINWSAQNQEHHSFDEHSYNFIHSKNSDEVSKIYLALKRFVNDMDPNESIFNIEKRLQEIEFRLERSDYKLANETFLKKAPGHIVAAEFSINTDLKKEQSELVEELDRLKLNSLAVPL
jgi:DNA sulfur modification protein DndD